MEEAVRCVWKKADSKREGDALSGNGTRILQAASWAQFWPHFLSFNNLGRILQDLIFYLVWVPQEIRHHIQTWQQVILTLRIVDVCLVGSMLLPLVLWPVASARFVLYVHVSWFPNKSRKHPVPHKFQCYQLTIPAAPQSSTDKHLARYFGAVFFLLALEVEVTGMNRVLNL